MSAISPFGGRRSCRSSFDAGTVDTVKVMRDMATGRARGFAFVEMATDNDAQAAIDKLHNYEFGGRNLTVERSAAAS